MNIAVEKEPSEFHRVEEPKLKEDIYTEITMYGYTSLVTASLLHVFFFLLVIDATNSQALPQGIVHKYMY